VNASRRPKSASEIALSGNWPQPFGRNPAKSSEEAERGPRRSVSADAVVVTPGGGDIRDISRAEALIARRRRRRPAGLHVPPWGAGLAGPAPVCELVTFDWLVRSHPDIRLCVDLGRSEQA
jgi:hypothetical protein